ncbi:serine phosphatase RsbU (regulator of sigma subunit) [Kitasatospora sp. MAA4]|uniref:PP2C family protein-serine/threonine phosphatase n=1 Tax=Kitasatospora sp. MAA4 TaxID=3035093 RepID=UPI00247324BB|nr:PP2C family protein-serine/threonine phosphatase [Kitasatospora sp. MAA4]MDH6132880.1 serine phosphatase RsbU (regulator of sigma subunit) [Kitasatospora sp. MAA4]
MSDNLLDPPQHSAAYRTAEVVLSSGQTDGPSGDAARTDTGVGSLLDDRPRDGRLAALDWLNRHTERLAHARGLAATLTALLDSGATLLGAGRGLLVPVARECADGTSGRRPAADCERPHTAHGTMVGLALDRAALGALETVPSEDGPFAGLLRPFDRPAQLLHPDLAGDPALGARFREVAAALEIGACFALPLATEEDGPLAAAVWFFEQPTAPTSEQQELARRYCAFAAPLLAGRLEADRRRRSTEALRRGLLPDHLPYVPGLRLAARWVPAGLDLSAGSDWYDAIALPDGSVGLSVGSVSGDGPGAGPASAPGAATAMGRIRAALRAYAVLEGEDPVSVLGDLELLLKTTEPARTATAVYACVEPGERRITLAGAGHCPPLLVTRYGADFVETSLSAPLGMLSCWEAPSVELGAERGDLLLLYTEGLARRCGSTLDAGQATLRKTAADAPREIRQDPDRLCAYLLTSCVGAGDEAAAGATDDLVLLAARFE